MATANYGQAKASPGSGEGTFSGLPCSAVMILGLFLTAIVGLGVSSIIHNIPPGYVGVVFDKVAHKVTASALSPGWTAINPLSQSIQEYPVTIQNYAMLQRASEGKEQGDDSVKVQSSDGQQLNLDVAIQYQVIAEETGALYTDWGGVNIDKVEDRVVRQYTRSTVPNVASVYGWEAIVGASRSQITDAVSQTLQAEFRNRHLRLVSFSIREIHMPETLVDILKKKIDKQQIAESTVYDLQAARTNAEKAAADALGAASRITITANAEAAATLIRAEAEAKANVIVGASLSPGLTDYRVKTRWNGILPQVSGNATPILDFRPAGSGTSPQTAP